MQQPLPSYSIIIETENLSLADSECLLKCLDSIRKCMEEFPHTPRQVLVINSGDLSVTMSGQLSDEYDFIEILEAPKGLGYYESKMLGARHVDADIVVFADSDCFFEEGWLAGLVTPFANPSVNIVAGETDLGGRGPYVLAMQIVHAFNGYSGADDIYPVKSYYANNFACRRQLLVDYPIPTSLPLYRSACFWHCVQLRRAGETVWAQPLSRAVHAPPEGLSHFFWRFLLFGRDRTVRARLGLIDDAPQPAGMTTGGVPGAAFTRLKRALRRRPGEAIWLPVSALIVVAAALLIRTGQGLAMIYPGLAINHVGAIEGVRYPSVEEYLRTADRSESGHE